MQHLVKIATLVAATAGAVGAQAGRGAVQSASRTASASALDVTFEYSILVDQPCYAMQKLPLDTALITAISRRMPLWREVWSRVGQQFFRITAATTHSPFTFAEAKAAIISCPGMPGMSLPLMINVRRLFQNGAPVANDTAQFNSLMFHENLHRYVSDQINMRRDSTTPLLTKYAAESPVVRAHLHVFALMDTVYRQARGFSNVLQPSGPTPSAAGGYVGPNDLDRAREIVKKESTAAFVRELLPKRPSSP